MANPKFKITKRKNGEFQFNLHAGNGEIIATSEGYTSKQNCEKGIDSVVKNAPIAEIEDLTL
ncbi:YegP family protein [uncultured Aquimarina sp.]|uniref:YegP family protein n=1 Tax=uncultured Aquimarina sp. TaxID=575652 RepID=UPI0026310571|nr:YegP family protein [uncultured Aquimarina sp.]